MTKVYTLERVLSVLELLKFFLNFIKILVTIIIILLTIRKYLNKLTVSLFYRKNNLNRNKRHR